MPRHAPLSFGALSGLMALLMLVSIGGAICEIKAASVDPDSEHVIDPGLPYAPAVTLPPGRIADLIERLAGVETFDWGLSPYVSGTAFRAKEGEGSPMALVLGSPEPQASEAFRELVRAGAPAVPYLVAHLDDWRATRLTIGHGGCVANLFLSPPDFSLPRGSRKKEVALSRYTIRIGDICFVALGQIVNRPYAASFYQPSFNVYVISPVHDPQLRAGLRDRWSGLTAQKHRDGLIRELQFAGYPGVAHPTLERLRFYYPDAVVPAVRAMFTAPRFCGARLEKLAVDSLYHATEAELPGRIAEVQIREDASVLHDIVEEDADHGPWQTPAARVLKLFPAPPAPAVRWVSDETLQALLDVLNPAEKDAISHEMSEFNRTLDCLRCRRRTGEGGG